MKRKLELNKETLRALAPNQAQGVDGGHRRTVGCVIVLPPTNMVCTFDPEPEPWRQ